MDKNGLIAKIAEVNQITGKDAKKAVDMVLEGIKAGIVEDGIADIYGFAKFSVEDAKERKCKNPQTGDEIVIPACKKVKVALKKAMKDLA